MNGIHIALITTIVRGPTVSAARALPISTPATDRIHKQKSEGTVNQQVRDFFVKYEKANSSSDVSAIGNLYAETFMFAGPNGAQAVRREDFLKVVPRIKAHYASMGVSETELHSMEMSTLDSKYVLATVVWRIKFRDSPGNGYVDASATYVLAREEGDALSIVFQLDHQDLASIVKGLQPTQP